MVRLSLIVPTCNRANCLEHALASFIAQNYDPAAYEILVIDNNSTDGTRDAVRRVMEQASCSWRYVFESRQGLHYARNTGILQARGDIVVFGDDDIVAEDTWLHHIAEEFDTYPATGIAGGRVAPLWNGEPEDWIYDYGTPYVHPVMAILDYGSERLRLEHEYVFGCNFAIRRSLALEIGGSYPDTFPREFKHLSGTGENAMIDNARAIGYEVAYLPDALVHHQVDASRLTLDYFIDRHERWAVEEAFHAFRHFGREEAVRRLIGLAAERLCRIERDCEHQIRSDYYRVVHLRSAHQLLEQVVRVLTDDALYGHITKENYLR